MSGYDPTTGATLRTTLGEFVLSEKEKRYGPGSVQAAFTKYLIDDWRGSRANLNASTHIRF